MTSFLFKGLYFKDVTPFRSATILNKYRQGARCFSVKNTEKSLPYSQNNPFSKKSDITDWSAYFSPVIFNRWLLMVVFALAIPSVRAEPVSYDRNVRPILTSNCYQCHGPDAKARKAKLRLDKEKTTRTVLKELLKRVSSHDSDERMPPPKSKPYANGSARAPSGNNTGH